MSAARDWAELLRVPALFTVPGDALAGAAATGLRPNPRTLLAMAASLSLYEAGMALNDWADRADDAVERPHRPLPSGRIAPAAALGAAAAFTAGGLALASCAGRPALTVASALAGTVWAYDLGLKHTPAGPAAMAAARGLDLLLGAAATGKGHPAGSQLRAAMPTALVLSAHTLAVTAVSRREAQGGSTAAPLGALAATAALTRLLAPGGSGSGRSERIGHGGGGRAERGGHGGGGRDGAPQLPAGRRAAATRGLPGSTAEQATPGAWRWGAGAARHSAPAADSTPGAWLTGIRSTGLSGLAAGAAGAAGAVNAASGASGGNGVSGANAASAVNWASRASAVSGASGAYAAPGVWRAGTRGAVQAALAATYAVTAARPLFHAALNPSPQLTQRAVGGGIRAMIPLQAALSARAGALGTALLTAALAPAARRFGRKVSVT